MTTVTEPVTKSFSCVMDGLSFEVELTQRADGTIEARITVLDGHADFNAIYWGDDVDDGSGVAFSGRDSSLNMNGAGSVDENGDPVDWDAALKLSSPGLGNLGFDKPTYLEAGDSAIFELPAGTSLDNIDVLGLRATSTSTPEGSIKCVLGAEEPEDPKDDDPEDPKDDPEDPKAEDPEDPKDDPEDPKAEDPEDPKDDDPEDPKDDPDTTPEWSQAISNVVFYYDTDGDGVADHSVKVDEWSEDAPRDLDDVLADMRGWIEGGDEGLQGATLLGVSIKGGTQETQYFAVDGNENGAEADPDAAPDPLLNTGPGNEDALFYQDFVEAFGAVDESAALPEDDAPEALVG
jgi:hypothetical protein